MRRGIALTPMDTRRDVIVRTATLADELGYEIFSVAEGWTLDSTVLLAELAAATRRITLAAGVLSVWGRTPATIAMTAATLHQLSGGRFVLGLGASTPQLVEGWHDISYDRPAARLRRLRHRQGEQHTTRLQDLDVRCHVTAAVSLLDWLAARDRALANCTQADLDTWAVGEHRYRDETAHFVRWAVTHKHAHGLTLGATRWHGPAGPHDTEKRWADARRLLHDDTLTIPDRVAGLLLLLYAQRIATITQLTADDIHDDGDTVAIIFGHVPITLPEPLAALVQELVATRKGSNIITAPDSKPWLFHGKRPGHPLSDDALGNRLKRVGLNPRQDRSTALFALATELPAAMLARMLGIHISVAVRWQQASSGDWTAYAADISRRTPSREHY